MVKFVTSLTALVLLAACSLSGMCAGKTIIVAHRGNSSVAPENTLAAFKSALTTKAQYVECDVYRTKDGALVVSHDNNVARTTGAKGDITQMTLAEVRALDAGSWRGPEFAGEKIPTLEEVLDTVKGKKQIVIEIKDPGAEDLVMKAVLARRMSASVIMASFSDAVGKRMQVIAPYVRYMQFVGLGQKPNAKGVEDMISMLDSMHCRILGINAGAVTPELAQAVHAKGMKLNVWTVDDPAFARSLVDMGADIVTTNAPATIGL